MRKSITNSDTSEVERPEAEKDKPVHPTARSGKEASKWAEFGANMGEPGATRLEVVEVGSSRAVACRGIENPM